MKTHHCSATGEEQKNNLWHAKTCNTAMFISSLIITSLSLACKSGNLSCREMASFARCPESQLARLLGTTSYNYRLETSLSGIRGYFPSLQHLAKQSRLLDKDCCQFMMMEMPHISGDPWACTKVFHEHHLY